MLFHARFSMLRSRKASRSRWLFSSVFITVCLWVSLAYALHFDGADEGWEGTSAFVELAKQTAGANNVIVTSELNWATLEPKDSIVLFHPERTIDGDQLSAFLRAGGRVAVMDDFGSGDRILKRYQIERVRVPEKPRLMLRNNPHLAIAEPVVDVVAGKRNDVHPIVSEVGKVVTNHATGLKHPDLSSVLKIRGVNEADVMIAVVGQVSRGRLFAMGDPSVVMNLMMRYPGNRAFAKGLIRYLVADDSWGKRHGKIYILSNRFQEKGVYGGANSAHRQLREWLRSFENFVQSIYGEGLPKTALLILAVLSTTAVLFWVASSAARKYRQPQPRFAREVPLVAQGGIAGRAAVLAAPTTHRGLILLEQKAALEAELVTLLSLPSTTNLGAAMEEIRSKSLLDPVLMREIIDVTALMAAMETALMSGQPIKVTRADLIKTDEVTTRVCQVLTIHHQHRVLG
jgi:hypothetical protein